MAAGWAAAGVGGWGLGVGWVSLFGAADFFETETKGFGELGFKLRSDEAGVVHVLYMDAVFEAIAGKLHAEEMSDRGDPGGVEAPRGDFGCGLGVVRTKLLCAEDEVNRFGRGRGMCINKHVQACGMTV